MFGLDKEKNKDENRDEEKEIPLTYKEVHALKKSDYDKIAKKFRKIFVLKNERTGQIVELRAASSFHACNIIGWKPNKVVVIEEKIVEDKPDTSTMEKEQTNQVVDK